MTTYTIKRRDEETECWQCGYPMMVGDKCIETADGDAVCSRYCGQSLERDRQWRRAQVDSLLMSPHD